MKNYFLTIVILLFISGCYRVGHEDFVDIENGMIGGRVMHYKPFKDKDAGKLRRGKDVIEGQGFTHITKMKNGDLVHHWSYQEILPSFSGNKKWIGKCLVYQIIDGKTGVVKSWGFDKGGNPLSCRSWS